MDKLSMTGKQATAAFALLKKNGISQKEFCDSCNVVKGSVWRWKVLGIKGACAKILYDTIGKTAWNGIKNEH